MEEYSSYFLIAESNSGIKKKMRGFLIERQICICKGEKSEVHRPKPGGHWRVSVFCMKSAPPNRAGDVTAEEEEEGDMLMSRVRPWWVGPREADQPWRDGNACTAV